MAISLHSTFDDYVQGTGRELAARVSSEEQAQQVTSRFERHNRFWKTVQFISLVTLVASLLTLWRVASRQLDSLTELWLGMILVSAFVGAISLDKVRRREAWLMLPISQHARLCEELYTAAQEDRTVRAYVSEVNASGRQLRIFDVAGANAAVVAAEAGAVAERQRQACVQLHSL